MRKLKLHPEDLRVASFQISNPRQGRGTVQGMEVGNPDEYQDSEVTACLCDTVTSWPTYADPRCKTNLDC